MEKQLTYIDGSGSRTLSPSALSSYLTCRLKFYFSYVAGIKEQDDVEEDISNQIFGKILHEAVDKIYSDMGKNPLTAEQLESIAKNELLIGDIIDAAFAKEFIRSEEGKSLLKMNGKFLLVRRVVSKYLQGILRYDASLIRSGMQLQMVALEQDLKAFYPFTVDGESRQLCLKGRLDRVDRLGGITRIVDYKTGAYKDKNTFTSFEKMFIGKDTQKYAGSMQTFLYSLMFDIASEGKAHNIKPALYFVRGIQTNDFDPYLAIKEGRNKTTIENYFDHKEEYLQYLNLALTDLFGANQPFDQTGDPTQMCRKYCPYNVICKR